MISNFVPWFFPRKCKNRPDGPRHHTITLSDTDVRPVFLDAPFFLVSPDTWLDRVEPSTALPGPLPRGWGRSKPGFCHFLGPAVTSPDVRGRRSIRQKKAHVECFPRMFSECCRHIPLGRSDHRKIGQKMSGLAPPGGTFREKITVQRFHRKEK